MLPESPPPTHITLSEGDRRRHDLRTTLTRLRLRTQLLRRLAHRQDGPAWPRVAADLAAIDDDLTTLVRQLEDRDGAKR